MRARLAYAAAAVGFVAAVTPWFTTHSYFDLVTTLVVIGTVVLFTLLATVLAVTYAAARVPDWVAWSAAATSALVGMLAGAAQYYLTYLSALLLALAVAAGEPLRPPDPGDDRMSRPMPRGDL